MITKEQVIEFLKEQESLQIALDNVDSIGKDLPAIINLDTDKVAFYFDKSEINSASKLKDRIVKHMKDNGWETRDREDYMDLKELMKTFNLKLRQ